MADDIGIEDLMELATSAEQNDVAIAMRDVYEAVEENYPDDEAVDEAVEDVTLPFNDAERELVFTLGMTFGAFLEQEFPDDGAE
jgi:glutamate synthase domain-containing protein 1